MNKFPFFLFCLLCFQYLNAQSTFTLRGKVIESETSVPIPAANIFFTNNEKKGTISDEDGFFKLSISKLPAEINVSHLGYKNVKVFIQDSEQKEILIYLESSAEPLPDIYVSAKIEVDTVFHKDYSVVDFAFSAEHIFLLAHKNSIEKYNLILLDEKEEVLFELSLKDKNPIEIHKACTGKIFLLTHLFAHELKIEQNKISFGDRYDILEYERIIKPCILENEDYRCFRHYYYQGQAMRYIAQSKSSTDTLFQLPIIEDEANIIRLLEDVGIRMPYSGDFWQTVVSDALDGFRKKEYELVGIMKIFYPKLDNPLFQIDGQLCLLNHQENVIQYFNEKGELFSSTPIEYHQNKKWKKQVFFDERKKQVYTSFDTRWGESFTHIDLKTGKLNLPISLDMAFIEKVKPWNGYLYFLFRNGERIRRLHKIQLH